MRKPVFIAVPFFFFLRTCETREFSLCCVQRTGPLEMSVLALDIGVGVRYRYMV